MQRNIGVITVNLTAIRHNWRVLRDVFAGRDCGAVVKADAYGLGYAPVVQALFSEGCRSFFVATFPEALEVQKLLAERASIYVLQGCPEGMEEQFLRAKIIPVLITEAMLTRWTRFSGDKTAPCAIKVNTGMNRLGLTVEELHAWVDDSGRWGQVNPVLLLSHLACADTPSHSLNRHQLECFRTCLDAARSNFPDIQASLTNSAGLFLGESWHFDVARPGIALYGGREGVPKNIDLRAVVTLSLPVLQVRRIMAGEWVGYGGDYQAERDMTIAIVACGYGDGVLRSLSNRGSGFFGEQILPVVGRVSMDSCAFDISGLPESKRPAAGAMIEVLGPHSDITLQAKTAGTISYELLTRLGGRLQRRYVED